MKVRRLYFTFHHDLNWVVNAAGISNGKYQKKQMSKDYPATMSDWEASRLLHEEFGYPPEMTDSKFPQGFARITHQTICDDAPEVGVIEAVRAYQPDLLSATDLKAAQTTKPTKRK